MYIYMYSRNVYTTIGSPFPSSSTLFHFFYLSLSLAFLSFGSSPIQILRLRWCIHVATNTHNATRAGIAYGNRSIEHG